MVWLKVGWFFVIHVVLNLHIIYTTTSKIYTFAYKNYISLTHHLHLHIHCKYILLEYVKMSKRDKNRINYSSNSLEQLEETVGDNLSYRTLQEATWTPEKLEEEKTKGKRGRKKGSKNKSKSK